MMKILFLIVLMLIPQSALCSDSLKLKKIKLPQSFSIELYATNIKGARAMTFSDDGTLFVGSKNGKVYAITKKRKVYKIDSGLLLPIGIDYFDKDLYVSDLTRIRKYINIMKNLKDPPAPIMINDTFPSDRHHGGKYVKIGPDRKIYVTIGAPCNVCLKEDNRYATITRMDLTGNNFEIYARGVRNSVGFDWHPLTGDLWFTDNGRDWMGDDSPPDELNRSWEKSQHFGFPFMHGEQIHDPDFWHKRPDVTFIPPAFELPAHIAPLGMRFYTGNMFPGYYKNGIFIAEHGSWNRSEKIGYRVSFISISDNKALSYSTFASGWLENESAWGRPVDVESGPDGALYVSDDRAGVIYRIYYSKEENGFKDR